MAGPSKNKSDNSQIDEAAEDAVELPDTIEASGEDQTDVEQVDDFSEASELPEDELLESDTTAEDADTFDTDEVTEVEAPDPTPEAPVTQPTSSSGGFLPLLLGGVAAAAIGYAFAIYGPNASNSDDLQAAMDAQAEKIDALQSQLDGVGEVDLSGIEGRLQTLSDEVAELASAGDGGVSDTLAALDERLTDLEKRPNSDGTLSETAIAAYQAELDALREELNAQQDSVMSAAAQAEADLEAARAEAERLEQEALAAAEAAAARAAINRIATAVETGAPFADAVADLNIGDLPAALMDAGQTGVATTAELVADFPDVARSALATARSEGLSDDTGGLSGFLRSQFDVRSTTPQEGSGPDAVLSRAEGAIKEGRVADALAELAGLPEVARAEMTDWTARAQSRADVLDAIATLSETYQ